jgi:hypothetical protein
MDLTFEYLKEKHIPELKEMFIQINPGDEHDENYEHNPKQVMMFLAEK